MPPCLLAEANSCVLVRKPRQNCWRNLKLTLCPPLSFLSTADDFHRTWLFWSISACWLSASQASYTPRMQASTVLCTRQACAPSCSYDVPQHRPALTSFSRHKPQPHHIARPNAPSVFTKVLSHRRPAVVTCSYGWGRGDRDALQQRLDEIRQQQEERRRVMQERQQRMMDALNQRRSGMGWQAYLLPAAGLGLLTLLLGPLIFGLLAAGLAIGTAVTFSAASMFFLLPLVGFALMLGGVGFGLSAGALLLPGLIFSAFNLVVLGGGLAAGFALTNSLLGGRGRAIAQESGPSRARAGSPKASKAPQGAIDVEAEVRDAEEREQQEAARAAEEELARFDELLETRNRQRQVEQGTRWKP